MVNKIPGTTVINTIKRSLIRRLCKMLRFICARPSNIGQASPGLPDDLSISLTAYPDSRKYSRKGIRGAGQLMTTIIAA